MRIVVADDHPMVRDAMAQLLGGLAPDAEIVVAADHDGLLALVAQAPCDLAVVDLHMPGADGLRSVRALHALQPALPLVVVSGEDGPGTARAVLEAGARGFVPKSESAATLAQAVRRVLAGGVFTPPHAVLSLRPGDCNAALPPAAAAPVLTPRLRDVLALLQQGAPNKAIAARLGLTEGTVKLHIAALLRALQARNRTEAVVRARALGLDRPPPD